jgi:hypothetical protein
MVGLVILALATAGLEGEPGDLVLAQEDDTGLRTMARFAVSSRTGRRHPVRRSRLAAACPNAIYATF